MERISDMVGRVNRILWVVVGGGVSQRFQNYLTDLNETLGI